MFACFLLLLQTFYFCQHWLFFCKIAPYCLNPNLIPNSRSAVVVESMITLIANSCLIISFFYLNSLLVLFFFFFELVVHIYFFYSLPFSWSLLQIFISNPSSMFFIQPQYFMIIYYCFYTIFYTFHCLYQPYLYSIFHSIFRIFDFCFHQIIFS